LITKLGLENFRAFQDEAVELKPVTVILGPNNSGKSSLIAAIRLLVQTLGSFDYKVPLLLDGLLGDFGTYRDVVYGNDRRRRIRIVIRIRRHPRRRRSSARPAAPWADLEAPEWELALKFLYRTRRRELILDEAELSSESGHLVTVGYSRDANRHVVTKVAGKDISGQVRARTGSEVLLQHFIPRVYPFLLSETRSGRRSRAASRAAEARLREGMDAGLEFISTLQDVEYVGPMRLPPARTYQYSGETHGRVGAQGENWAAIMALDATTSGNGRAIGEDLDQWLRGANLASDIQLDWISDRHYEVRVQHPVSKEYENLADVGQGNSQVLPVLVAGFRLRRGGVFMVEEPEIHLHPHAQAELGNFFLTLYQRGVQSLIETHSEYLILRLQQHVAAGLIPYDHIAFYYVQATESEKEVTVLELDSQAVFTNPVPGGFFPQKLEEAKELARIRATQEPPDKSG